jgi:hypothetical protein
MNGLLKGMCKQLSLGSWKRVLVGNIWTNGSSIPHASDCSALLWAFYWDWNFFCTEIYTGGGSLVVGYFQKGGPSLLRVRLEPSLSLMNPLFLEYPPFQASPYIIHLNRSHLAIANHQNLIIVAKFFLFPLSSWNTLKPLLVFFMLKNSIIQFILWRFNP